MSYISQLKNKALAKIIPFLQGLETDAVTLLEDIFGKGVTIISQDVAKILTEVQSDISNMSLEDLETLVLNEAKGDFKALLTTLESSAIQGAIALFLTRMTALISAL